MKNPNGYGTVVKLSGNRRKPFTARKTTGWNSKGHPIYLVIGYYATKEEGLIALAEYNKNPYDIDTKNVTLKDLYEQWLEKIFPKLGKSLQGNLKSAWKYIQPLENLKYRDIRSYQMQDTIDNCGKSYSTQGTIKNLWGYLDKLAMEMDVIDKMYSQLTKSAQAEESDKIPFSEEEIQILWDHTDNDWVQIILIMIYSGWRIQEMVTLHVDLEEGTMKGGVKTRAGKGRIVPIHSRILPFVKARCQNETLLGDITTKTLREHFKKTLTELGMNHLPHETRHTFRTRLDTVNANQKCIDLMMGHQSQSIGERVYTHKTIQELKEAIELLK